MKGKVIKVIGDSSIFRSFLGRYGVVLDKAYNNKWKVEFNATTWSTGALIHTIDEKDFKVIGSINSRLEEEAKISSKVEAFAASLERKDFCMEQWDKEPLTMFKSDFYRLLGDLEKDNIATKNPLPLEVVIHD